MFKSDCKFTFKIQKCFISLKKNTPNDKFSKEAIAFFLIGNLRAFISNHINTDNLNLSAFCLFL
jgi:hypothetical protein